MHLKLTEWDEGAAFGVADLVQFHDGVFLGAGPDDRAIAVRPTTEIQGHGAFSLPHRSLSRCRYCNPLGPSSIFTPPHDDPTTLSYEPGWPSPSPFRIPVLSRKEVPAKYNGTFERVFDRYKQTLLAKSQQKNVKK